MSFLHRTIVGEARPSERDDMASLHIVWVLQKEKGLPEFDNELEHNYFMSRLVIRPWDCQRGARRTRASPLERPHATNADIIEVKKSARA